MISSPVHLNSFLYNISSKNFIHTTNSYREIIVKHLALLPAHTPGCIQTLGFCAVTQVLFDLYRYNFTDDSPRDKTH